MPDADDKPAKKTFLTVLAAHGGGTTADDLTQQLQDLVMTCALLDKPGTLTLKIAVRPEGNAFIVSADAKVNKPTRPQASFYYSDDEGLLSRNDPHQPALDFRDPRTEPHDYREV